MKGFFSVSSVSQCGGAFGSSHHSLKTILQPCQSGHKLCSPQNNTQFSLLFKFLHFENGRQCRALPAHLNKDIPLCQTVMHLRQKSQCRGFSASSFKHINNSLQMSTGQNRLRCVMYEMYMMLTHEINTVTGFMLLTSNVKSLGSRCGTWDLMNFSVSFANSAASSIFPESTRHWIRCLNRSRETNSVSVWKDGDVTGALGYLHNTFTPWHETLVH